MVEDTFWAGTLLTLLEGLGYVAAGYVLSGRHVSPPERVQAALFVAWWVLAGINKLLSTLAGVGYVAGILDADGYIVVVYANVLFLCASLWCLLSFLLYLVTGSTRIRKWVGLLYGAYYVLLTYHILDGRPTGVGIGSWRTFLVSASDTPPLRGLIVLLLLVVPQVLAVAAYLALFPKVHDRTRRYRILLVAGSILGWTASILIVSLPAFAENAGLQVASRIIGAGAAILVLLAYMPPRWLAARLRVRGLADERASPVEPKGPSEA